MIRFLPLFFLLFAPVLFAQKTPDLSKIKIRHDRLQKWAEYCDELIAKENYTELRKAGKKGLSMTLSTDYDNLSLFSFYTGMTFNYGVETDSAAFYLEKSEALARKAKNSKRTLEALKQLHYVYGSYGSTKKRERIITAFEQVIDTTKSLKEQGNIYSILGDYYTSLGEYELGLSNMLKGIKVGRKLLPESNATDSTNFGVELIVLGELYLGMEKYAPALNYLKESEAFVKDYNEATSHTYKDLMECYLATGNLLKAKSEYRKLQKLLKNETAIGCWGMLLESDLGFAKYYLKKQQFTDALASVNHARELAPRYADEFSVGQIDATTGNIYLEMKDYHKALVFLKAAEPKVAEDDPELNGRLKLALARTYRGLGKWKEAYRYQEEYVQIQDKLFAEKSKKNLAEMEARYQNERKQGEINRLSAKNTINNLKIEEAQQQKIYFVITIFAVMAIGGLFYRQSRNRKKHNAQLQVLNEELVQANAIKARFFSIINHDLRSPVANLIHFLQLQKESPDLLDEVTKERLQNSTMSGAEHLLQSMEDMLLWSKGQMEQFKPVEEELLLRDVFKELETYFESEEGVELVVDKTTDLILHTDVNYLQTILRNLTGNAIKALQKVENGKVVWSAEKEGEHIVLKITDNGPGTTSGQFKALFDETEVVGIKTGLGLHLIRDLAKAIDCGIEVKSEAGAGTVIILRF